MFAQPQCPPTAIPLYPRSQASHPGIDVYSMSIPLYGNMCSLVTLLHGESVHLSYRHALRKVGCCEEPHRRMEVRRAMSGLYSYESILYACEEVGRRSKLALPWFVYRFLALECALTYFLRPCYSNCHRSQLASPHSHQDSERVARKGDIESNKDLAGKSSLALGFDCVEYPVRSCSTLIDQCLLSLASLLRSERTCELHLCTSLSV